MRLRQFNPANIRVRRGGWGGGLPGGGGKLGCGAIVITIIAAMVLGVDPSQMLGTIEGLQQRSAGRADANNRRQHNRDLPAEPLCARNLQRH